MSNDKDEGKVNKILRLGVPIIITVFVVIVGFICLKGLIVSINTFMENQRAFNTAYSKAAASLTSLSPNDQETIQVSLDHLERLQIIQKNAAANDVMSFLYSLLSTVLVGLCAGFVTKSQKSAGKADLAVKKAEKNAEVSKNSADAAKKSAEASITSAEKMETKVTALETTVENAVASANASEESAVQIVKKVAILEENTMEVSEKYDAVKADAERVAALYREALFEIRKQKDTMSVLSIHIEIVHARSSLLLYDQIGANQRVYTLSRMVSDVSAYTERRVIYQLQSELLSLETAVEQFQEYAQGLTDEGDKESMLKAATRYLSEIEQAVKHCDKLMKNPEYTEYNT